MNHINAEEEMREIWSLIETLMTSETYVALRRALDEKSEEAHRRKDDLKRVAADESLSDDERNDATQHLYEVYAMIDAIDEKLSALDTLEQ